ncbi:DNA-directed RNA polymerase [Aquibium microcysteis]|uniref:DNA-directed RNA polymerase n=1 Tax=Aquibium microcysteis TaxID=675281 RepID=UPI00165D00C8|nr:DNA-directed RNA polymerase [Aquibium microcysteis]
MMEVQAELEARMASLGIERFRRQALETRQAGQATNNRSMQLVLDAVIVPTTSAILKFRDDAGAQRAGRRHTAARFFAGIEAEALAFIAAKLLLDGIAQAQNVTRLAVRIGSTVEMEQRLDAFSKHDAKNYKGTTKWLDGQTDHLEHRRKTLMRMLAEHGDNWDCWTDRDRLLVGLKLIELVCQSSGLFEVHTNSRKKRVETTIEPTQRFRDWLASLDTQFELMAPEFLPCVVPPKDWTGLSAGGYLTNTFVHPLPLVKTRHKAHRDALKKADLSFVMEQVNVVQRTAWAVNDRVLEVAKALMGTGSEVAGLPPMSDRPIPSKPADIDTNEEARLAWRKAAAPIYRFNRTIVSKRLLSLKAVGIAEEFAKYPAIYFPHQLDFRGRAYAVPQVLNPQGSDLAKGLLQFAEGDPLTYPEQDEWFLIHGANSFGVDKVSFIERIEWTYDNAAHIMQAAQSPLDYLWWAEADSPFVFLAWCFEYLAWTQAKITGEGFRTRIPIAMDGSCNGLQHYSAMLRDPVAGAAVNLVPSEKPQDIYKEVADRVMDNLHHIAMSEHRTDAGYATEEDRNEWALANQWGAFGIDRKLTKRPVMVLPYGGTQRSCFQYVQEAVEARILSGQDNPFGDELPAAVQWLAARVWEAIGEVVLSARLAMGWLQDVARVVTKEGLPIQWTAPSGFVVVQAYPELTSQRIDTTLLGSRFAPRLNNENPDVLDRRRQVNGIAPNFVHSLDAAALILTVAKAHGRGITKFAMIHDSYGTTAHHAPALAQAIRQTFLEMYEPADTLDKFKEEVVPAHLADRVPSSPMVGGLDLSAVLRSAYFFA